MYFLYLDESGGPNGWQDQNHFVVGGVAVHEGQVGRLTKQINDIQTSHLGSTDISIQFHAGKMKSGDDRWRQVPLDIREKMLGEVYDTIGNAGYPNLVAFATALHISKAGSQIENLRATFEDVCSRFNTFLVRMHKTGSSNKGLLIIDDAHKEEYRDLVNEFRRYGVKSGYIGNIVDIPYFSQCKETRMLQLADFCTYAVFRYYEKNDRTYLDKIYSRFDRRDKFHPPDGLKHLTKDLSCTCIDCSWRRKVTRQQQISDEEPGPVEPFG